MTAADAARDLSGLSLLGDGLVLAAILVCGLGYDEGAPSRGGAAMVACAAGARRFA